MAPCTNVNLIKYAMESFLVFSLIKIYQFYYYILLLLDNFNRMLRMYFVLYF